MEQTPPDLPAAAALRRLAALARPADAALADWADQAARRLAANLPADRALGMDPATMARLRRAERNRLLREACGMLPGDGPWTQALRLAAEIETCESRVFPHWRAIGGPPDGASALRRCLWAARQVGRLPGPRMLAEICRGF
jgi:hypothetical protein